MARTDGDLYPLASRSRAIHPRPCQALRNTFYMTEGAFSTHSCDRWNPEQ